MMRSDTEKPNDIALNPQRSSARIAIEIQRTVVGNLGKPGCCDNTYLDSATMSREKHLLPRSH